MNTVQSVGERPAKVCKLLDKRCWKCLNSPLVVMLFSSGLLALLGWAFAQWQAAAVDSSNRRLMIARINIEIASRLQSAVRVAALAKNAEQFYVAIYALRINVENRQGDVGEFPEFRNRSIRSLLSELTFLDKSPQGISDVKKALDAVEELDELAYKKYNEFTEREELKKKTVDPSERNQFDNIMEQFSPTRWPRQTIQNKPAK